MHRKGGRGKGRGHSKAKGGHLGGGQAPSKWTLPFYRFEDSIDEWVPGTPATESTTKVCLFSFDARLSNLNHYSYHRIHC